LAGTELVGLRGKDFTYWEWMKSMTGYGRGDCSKDGFKVTVELSSVNRKQAEISVNLPRGLELLEAQIREVINRYIARGRLAVRVTLHAGAGQGPARMHVNVPLAKAYAQELSRLSRRLRLPGPVTLDQVARAPGVLQTPEDLAVEEDFWPSVEKALKQALSRMVKMREREGAHLAADLAKRVAVMRKAAAQVAKQAPMVAERYRQQLIERIKSAGLEAPGVEDERLLKEVVYFADRSDITEELVRARSHLAQFRTVLGDDAAKGRKLDFLIQEIFREINTTSNKVQDAGLSGLAVEIKTELEKIREQVQNLE
jgi:uncharacterized protein (TIGR00255 family)